MTSDAVDQALEQPHTTLVTVCEAAALAGVKPATIRQWARREHLFVVAMDDLGRNLYLTIDVLRAERTTRRHDVTGRARLREIAS